VSSIGAELLSYNISNCNKLLLPRHEGPLQSAMHLLCEFLEDMIFGQGELCCINAGKVMSCLLNHNSD